MHVIDWLVIVIPIIVLLIIGVLTHRQMKSVAHFVSGGRAGGRYLLAVAKGEMQAGAVVFVAAWEIFAQAGFVPTWWAWISVPVTLVVAIFGFVIYRFRETRAMTLAQFFEMRYSRNFRSFTGWLGFIAGILNFGIIPVVGARCMVYLMQLPPEFSLGGFTVATHIPLMGLFLLVSTALTLSGGLITLMVTDCVEGIFSQLMYIVLIIGVLSVVSWSQMADILGGQPSGHSMVNPFDAWQVQDFNLWYILMGLFITTYGTMAWQNSSAYNTAGASPHEARMAGLLGRWRENGKSVIVVLLAASAIAFIGHPDFMTDSIPAREAIAGIEDVQIQKQMTIPIALSHLLPIGVKGALCAILIMGIFGGDSTHLHSWGGIFAQDVVLPRLKKAPTPKHHIRMLRWSIIGVAVFAFFFGIFFPQTEYIVMWWSITISLYVGGAGSAIIGGLYWKKGTTAGAWTAMITGSILAGGGIIAYKVFGNDFLAKWLQFVGFDVGAFTLNPMQISFFASLCSIALYILVSLATNRVDYPINKMLHREEAVKGGDSTTALPRPSLLARIIGIDQDFTRGDKWIVGTLFGWSILWFAVLVVGSCWNLLGATGYIEWIRPWPNHVWLTFWHVIGIGLPILITVITGIWFTFGGIKDIVALFRSLRGYKIDDSDNGTVAEHKPW